MFDRPELRQFVLKSGMADQPSLERAWKKLDWNERSTVIGFYAIAPSGRPLASYNKNPRPAGLPSLLPMLKQGLERWSKLSKSERLLPGRITPKLARGFRWSHYVNPRRVPAGTLVLRSYTKDLPRGPFDPAPNGNYGAEWTRGMWNMDATWWEKPSELLPAKLKPGQKFRLPERFVQRLVRFQLVDNVLGLTTPFEPQDVRFAYIDGVVTSLEDGLATVRLSGATKAVANGVWQQSEVSTPLPAERGFETALHGWVRYDQKREKFEQFDLLASGKRWGSTFGNRRFDDEYPPYTDNRAPSPIGVAFTLFPGTVEDAVPPMMLMRYGEKYLGD